MSEAEILKNRRASDQGTTRAAADHLKWLLLRVAGSVAVRTGRGELFKEIRRAFDPLQRRYQRDAHAMRVLLTSVLRPDSSAIDVGAHAGVVLREIVRVAPHGRHLAFEPIPKRHVQLQAAFPGVDVRQAALSDTAGRAEFSYVTDDDGYSGLRLRRDLGPAAASVEQIQVSVARLDDELPQGFAPALIKIDVEGAEVNVLRGALETLHRHRPVVIFEHGAGGADLYGATSGELHDLLTGAGFRIFDLDGDGPYHRARFEALFTEPVSNYVAVPNGELAPGLQ